MKSPVLIVPQLVTLAPTFLVGFEIGLSRGVSVLFGPLPVIAVLVTVVLALIISGSYPPMVQAIMSGGRPSVVQAVTLAVRRFWSLLAASVLVAIIVAIGIVLVVVPGIIFMMWYAYSIPAVMLNKEGALEGMASSKRFGRDKKLSTFLIFLIVGIVSGIVFFALEFGLLVISPILGVVLLLIYSVLVAAYSSTLWSYTYIAYGPMSQPQQQGQGYGVPSPLPVTYGQASTTQPRFCANCGASLPPGAKFCMSCGQPVAT